MVKLLQTPLLKKKKNKIKRLEYAQRHKLIITRTNVVSAGSVFKVTRKVKFLSLPETMKDMRNMAGILIGGKGFLKHLTSQGLNFLVQNNVSMCDDELEKS